jgi:hypothetical protein
MTHPNWKTLAAIAIWVGTAAVPLVFAQDELPETLHRGHAYPGAQHFSTLPTAVIVYPAAEAEAAPRNLRSASALAAYLRSQAGMSTRIVADVEVTEGDLSDNLLILGWENRLFGAQGKPSPYSHAGTGLRFLGVDHPDRDADLLFFSRSPWSPDRFVLFWSRLDPERDRFSVLPRVGSDWAIYEEFLVVRQGMFLPGGEWPPRRDPRAEANHLPEILEERGQLSTKRTKRYDIHWHPTEFTSDEIDRIASAREQAFDTAATTLGTPSPEYRISLFLYGSSVLKKARSGVPDPAHSAPWARELHLVRSVAFSTSPHEETHLLARESLGPAFLTSLYEGLAISVEGRVSGLSLGIAGAVLWDSGALPPLAALLDEEEFRHLPDAVGPPAAVLRVWWLRDMVPPERFAEIYRLSRGDPSALAAELGKAPDTIDEAYRAWVSRLAASHENDVKFRRAELKAQEHYASGDWSGMITALNEALTFRPDDPQTLFNLASAQMRADSLEDAEATLRRLLSLPLVPGQSRFRVFGHYQLGRVFDLRGRRDEAVDEYEKVLRLPDESRSHQLARERILQPATRDQLE